MKHIETFATIYLIGMLTCLGIALLIILVMHLNKC